MELTTALLITNTLLLAVLAAMLFHQGRSLRHRLHEARLELRKHVIEAGKETRKQIVAVQKEAASSQKQRFDTLQTLLLDGMIGPRGLLNPVNLTRLAQTDLHVVLALPKVGSTTVHLLLKGAQVGGEVVHRHGVSTEHLAKKLEDYLQPPHRPTYVRYASTSIQIRLHELHQQMGRPHPPRTWYYAGVRDPLAQMISLVFQRLRSKEYPGDDTILEQLHAQARDPAWQMSFDAWFDRECRDFFGFDAFLEEFDHQRGWMIYPGERTSPVRIFLFRLENIAAVPVGLAQMHGLPVSAFPIERSHSGEDSKNGAAYQRVRAAFRLPQEVLEPIYATRYCRHFYTKPEREAFIEKWTDRPSAATIHPDLLQLKAASEAGARPTPMPAAEAVRNEASGIESRPS